MEAGMKRYLTFPLQHRSEVVVAEVVELTDETGHEPAALAGRVAAQAGETFEVALEKVKPIAKGVIAALADIGAGISEVNVEFGIKLSAHAGVILTSGGVEANFNVSLKWKPGQVQA
jgi:hypothetical protein